MTKKKDDLQPGDKVSWKSRFAETTGHVEKKATQPTKVKGHKVNAKPDDPQYIVKSEKTGAKAAHKPQALHKKK